MVSTIPNPYWLNAFTIMKWFKNKRKKKTPPIWIWIQKYHSEIFYSVDLLLILLWNNNENDHSHRMIRNGYIWTQLRFPSQSHFMNIYKYICLCIHAYDQLPFSDMDVFESKSKNKTEKRIMPTNFINQKNENYINNKNNRMNKVLLSSYIIQMRRNIIVVAFTIFGIDHI